MARKAKHHYIPKCYLKNFTEGGKNDSNFWAVPKSSDKPFLTSPNDACSKRDYYSMTHSNPLIVENFYGEKIEPMISKAIRHINTNSCLPHKADMQFLILLLATLYLRVPSHRETLERPRRRMKEIIESMSQDIHISNKEEFDYSETDLIKQELELLQYVQKLLSNKYYQLHIIEDADLDVITSDKPFVLTHPNGGRGFHFGLDTPNIDICVPITSKAILIARNEVIKEGTFTATKELVGLVNNNLIFSANRYFYTKKEEVLLINDDLTVFKHNILTD